MEAAEAESEADAAASLPPSLRLRLSNRQIEGAHYNRLLAGAREISIGVSALWLRVGLGSG